MVISLILAQTYLLLLMFLLIFMVKVDDAHVEQKDDTLMQVGE